jgi:hypothetical protein
MVIIIRLLLEKFLQLSARLADQGGRKAAGGFLALGGQILDSHIEQGNIFLEPAQSFPYARNAEIVGQHDKGSPIIVLIFKSATFPRWRKSQGVYLNGIGN